MSLPQREEVQEVSRFVGKLRHACGGWDASDAMYGTRKRFGVFRYGTWILDTNGNNAYDAADGVGSFGLPGDKPVVGNWSMQ